MKFRDDHRKKGFERVCRCCEIDRAVSGRVCSNLPARQLPQLMQLTAAVIVFGSALLTSRRETPSARTICDFHEVS